MLYPFRCPICNGYKTVQKPPWIAGDQDTWVSEGTALYPCPICNGTGIIWSENKKDEIDVNQKQT